MRTIACLHVAFDNVALFESALSELGVRDVALHHVVRPELFANRDLDGAALEVLALSSHADAVMVTCSTLGPAAEQVAPILSIPTVRADRALADAAVSACEPGGTVALAQVSMAPAATSASLAGRVVLGVPDAALSSLLRRMDV